MKNIVFLFLFAIAFLSTAFANQPTKARVIAMTDGEVDDRCSMVRFLLYTNDIELEAIIQTNSVYQPKGWSSSNWLNQQIDAYEQVYPNLKIHDPAYPSPNVLRSKIFVGDEDSTHIVVDRFSNKRVPGMEPAIDPADWADTPGSDKIVEVLLEDDPRPVYIQVWGGGNTAAKAFYKLKTEYPNDYKRAVSKAIMYNIWYQDGAGNYIEKYHPEVTLLLSFYFSGTWDYGSMAFTHNFVENDVKNNHGPLGTLYPQDYISEGDSPAFLYSLYNGLRSYENPNWGGWGGRFYKVDGFKNVYRDIDKGSYLKWIEYANRDFKSRLDWCVAENFEDANHKPTVKIKGELDLTVKSGELVELEAEISDPDALNVDELWGQAEELYTQAGLDKERFAQYVETWSKTLPIWWQYKDAGTFDGMIQITNPDANKIQFIAPEVKEPETIHMILEVKDRGVPALTSFARVVITVLPVE
ncbi:nucleoside hydrolase-like domain-containing protein [Draconibacterium orientale]|uniref:nucleoside hydrolase-like domain-containing protein n=1 Tax=Draconibacterium orientale TaxID=1168034 RepID=UPI0029C0E9A3|nr:nucleoside hydrolase-like domain-containing protein [Draconibacterium orientale]